MMRIEVQPGDEAWPQAKPLFDAVWPPEVMATIVWRDVVWANALRRALVFDGSDQPVCHVGIYVRDARWNDRGVKIGGIGGVATRPDCRRNGFAGAAMKRSVEDMATRAAVDFGLLFCEPHNFAFYQGLGWHRFDGEVFVEQPAGRVRFDVTTPFVYDLNLTPRAGVIDLCGLPW